MSTKVISNRIFPDELLEKCFLFYCPILNIVCACNLNTGIIEASTPQKRSGHERRKIPRFPSTERRRRIVELCIGYHPNFCACLVRPLPKNVEEINKYCSAILAKEARNKLLHSEQYCKSEIAKIDELFKQAMAEGIKLIYFKPKQTNLPVRILVIETLTGRKIQIACDGINIWEI